MISVLREKDVENKVRYCSAVNANAVNIFIGSLFVVPALAILTAKTTIIL